ncbi:hypothetical protein GCM10009835_15150 [Planosporangium flavigriseum]
MLRINGQGDRWVNDRYGYQDFGRSHGAARRGERGAVRRLGARTAQWGPA